MHADGKEFAVGSNPLRIDVPKGLYRDFIQKC